MRGPELRDRKENKEKQKKMGIKDFANHKLRSQLQGRDESSTKDLIIIEIQGKILERDIRKSGNEHLPNIEIHTVQEWSLWKQSALIQYLPNKIQNILRTERQNTELTKANPNMSPALQQPSQSKAMTGSRKEEIQWLHHFRNAPQQQQRVCYWGRKEKSKAASLE